MRSSSREDCQELLAHAGWVRSLARYLAADAHTGDDLAQEALAAALTSPPPGDRSLRSWLGAIVRNLVRRERRSAGNRVARERAVARDDAEASECLLDAHLETHRAVVDAVARLAEPYRSAILMRYFEELSPAAIAARTGTPLRTVHTRLHRGLNALRADLDRAHGGDRKSWLLALIPYARGSRGWSTAAIGALVMDAKLKIALGALAVVGVCSTLALWSAGAKDGSPASPLAAAPSAIDGERAGDPPRMSGLAGATEIVERRAEAVPTEPPPAVPAKAVEASRLSGRVIDVERAPVASVRVRCFDPARPADAVEATTDAHGAFELADPGERVRLDVASPGWTAVLRPDTQQVKSSRELVLVVARSVKLAGLVVDEHGHPVESATVAVPLPFGMRARFDAILDASSTVEPSVRTGADGRFVLEAAPSVAGAKLVTSHAAYVNDEREVPARDELAFEIVLRSVRTAPERLVGKVVDPAGAPVEGAWVALGDASAKSGPGGTFALELSAARRTNTKEAEATILRAVKRGFLPGELVRAGGSDWPATIVLALGEPPLAIAGRVVDAKGAPVPGAEVWTDEETHFGYIDIEGGEMTMRAGANVEGILRGDPWTRRVRTDAGGYFELGGLLAHDYRVHALDKRHVSVTTVSAPAGVHNVEIRMPDEEHFARVAGRVTSLSGDPIEGLEVALERHVAGIQGTEVEGFASRATRTDADGRFTFGEIARAVDLVRVSGEQLGLTGFEHPITRDDDVEKLVIAVPVSVHVQVDGGELRDFDQVALLDARGEKLQISVYHGQSAYAMREITVQEGRTEPFTVSESAKTLVLYTQKVEVRRVSVELEPGKLNTLRP